MILRRAALAMMFACGGAETPPATEAVLEGNPPALVSWSGAGACCGEDPHPVHGAVLSDGSVVMVGKAAGQGGTTEGFITRWQPTQGPARGEFVDEGTEVIKATASLPSYSSLLQVAEAESWVVAVGFQSENDGTATALALALNPGTLEVERRLTFSAANGESAVLESIEVDGSIVRMGGATNAPLRGFEGFKSYGNVHGGVGLLVEVDLSQWEQAEENATAEQVGATITTWPSVQSLKSLAVFPDGRVAAVAMDQEEESGVLWINADKSGAEWALPTRPVELTDLTVTTSSEGAPLLAISGHGGEDTIDGQGILMAADGSVLWQTAFGNPSVSDDEIPSGGLAPDAYIFDECWGITPFNGELVLACGSGIEGCGAIQASSSDKQRCQTDPRRAWRSYMVGIDLNGSVQWSRTESFVDRSGEGAESAAEFTMATEDTLYGVIDQVFGVGLLRLEPQN